MGGGGGFDLVGFVEDDVFVGGEHVSAFGAEGEVGEEEGVVDDEDAGIL